MELRREEIQTIEAMTGQRISPEIEEMVLGYHDLMAVVSGQQGIMSEALLGILLICSGFRRDRVTIKNDHEETERGTRVSWTDHFRTTWGTFQHVCEAPRQTYCRVHLLGDPDYPQDVQHDQLKIMDAVEKKPEQELPFAPGTPVLAEGREGIFRSMTGHGRLRVELESGGMVSLESFAASEVQAYEPQDANEIPAQGWQATKLGHPVTVSVFEDGDGDGVSRLHEGTFQGVTDSGLLRVVLDADDTEFEADPDDVVLMSTVLSEA